MQDTALPYSALVEAVTSLCRSICRRKHIREDIKRRLTKELGDEAVIMTSLIPAIDKLLVNRSESSVAGTSASTHSSRGIQGPKEHAFHRVTDLFCLFLRTIASSNHPLVLFIDDTQWADETSVRLLSALMNDPKSKNIFLVLAARMGDTLSQDRSHFSKQVLNITSLDRDAVTLLLASATQSKPEEMSELGELLHFKTGGNPFFCTQYVRVLHREGILAYNFNTNKWEFDKPAVVARTSISPNVLDLLTGKFETLEAGIQRVLTVASCLGFRFCMTHLELAMTAVADNKDDNLSEPPMEQPLKLPVPSKEVKELCQEAIESAIEAGMVESVEGLHFKFTHDRIQQSAASMVPSDDEGVVFRQRLGKAILSMRRHQDESDKEWMLFKAVDLLTKASEASDDTSNIVANQELADLNLEAAQKAASRSAFLSAARFAEGGYNLLPKENRWDDNYDLSLELLSLSLSMYYACGDFEKTGAMIEEVIANAKTTEDKIHAFHVKIDLLGSRGDLTGGIVEGRALLQKLGIDFPPQPTMKQIVSVREEAGKLRGDRDLSSICDLPMMTDKFTVESLRVLEIISIYAWHSGDLPSCLYACILMPKLTLSKGLSRYAPYSMSAYACTEAFFNDLELAFNLGEMASTLIEKLNIREEAPCAIKVAHLFAFHLRNPLQDSLGPLLDAYQLGMQVGDIQIASRLLAFHGILSVIAGMPIESLEEQIGTYCNFFREYRQDDCLMDTLPWLQFARALVGKNQNPCELEPTKQEREESTRIMQDPGVNGNITIGLYELSAHLLLLCTFGEFKRAVKKCSELSKYDCVVSTYFVKPFLIFTSGLAYFGQASKLNRGLRRYKLRRLGQKQMEILEGFVRAKAVNCVPLLKLLQAEESALDAKNNDKTLSLYTETIAMSARSGFRLVLAIASERAGEFLLRIRREDDAMDYIQRAYVAFAGYGARAKVIHMQDKYNHQMDASKLSSTMSLGRSSASMHMQPNFATNWQKEV